MPQVPYTPVPNVQPSSEATPGLRVNLSPESFGVGIASAIGHLGKAVEGAGNEMFERAKAIQELQNETQARENGTLAAKEMGELHIKQTSLTGLAAEAAYPDYVKGLDAIRQKYRQGLNPMAARHYDSDTYSIMNRHIFNGAGHASAQVRAAAKDAVESQEAIDRNQVQQNPMDQRIYDKAIEKAENNTSNDPTILSPEGADVKNKEKISAITVARLRGMADSSQPGGGPLAAWEEYQRIGNKLFGDDGPKVRAYLQNKMDIQQTEAEANKITDWMIHPSERTVKKSEASMLDDARAVAEKQRPGDAAYASRLLNSVRIKIGQNETMQKRADQENYRKVWDAIQRLDIKDPRMIDADPVAKEAYWNLPDTIRRKIPGEIYRYQESKERPYREEALRRLQGLRQEDPAAFQDVDPTKEPHLTSSQIDRVKAWQKKDRASPYQDPTVTRAFGWLREARGTMLQSLKIYNRGDNSDEGNRFDTFRGGLQQALEAWKEAHGKPASRTDVIETIAPSLLREVHNEAKQPTIPLLGIPIGAPYPGEAVPFFQQEVPTAFKNYFTTEAMKGGEQPSEEQIARAWLRKGLNELYSKNKKGDKGVVGGEE